MQPSAERARQDADAAARAHFAAGQDADPTPPADVPEWLKNAWKSGYMTRWRLLMKTQAGRGRAPFRG